MFFCSDEVDLEKNLKDKRNDRPYLFSHQTILSTFFFDQGSAQTYKKV